MRLSENIGIRSDVVKTLEINRRKLEMALKMNAQATKLMAADADARIEVVIEMAYDNGRDTEYVRFATKKGLQHALKGAILKSVMIINKESLRPVETATYANVLMGQFPIPLESELYIPLYEELCEKIYGN